jgi:hypothetical protein
MSSRCGGVAAAVREINLLAGQVGTSRGAWRCERLAFLEAARSAPRRISALRRHSPQSLRAADTFRDETAPVDKAQAGAWDNVPQLRSHHGMPCPVRGAFLVRFWIHCCRNETGSKKQPKSNRSSEALHPTRFSRPAPSYTLYGNALIEVTSYRRALSGLGNEQRKQAGHQVEGIDLPLEDKEPDSGCCRTCACPGFRLSRPSSVHLGWIQQAPSSLD